MWFGPLWMVAWIVLLVALVAAVIRWLGPLGREGERPSRSARDILDERYARGEIDRDEYIRRKEDIAGRSE